MIVHLNNPPEQAPNLDIGQQSPPKVRLHQLAYALFDALDEFRGLVSPDWVGIVQKEETKTQSHEERKES
jgi:hypothetical protein